MAQGIEKVLVTGGAGYIGSHAARALALRGHVPICYDNLVYGHRWAVRSGPLIEGDIADRDHLTEVLRNYGISAIMHFAAFAYVGESVTNPRRYFENNVTKSLVLLDAAVDAGVRYFVFSSSCATYGTPATVPIGEDTRQQPVNPYGETKLIIEKALRWYGGAYDMRWAVLRYFNAAGAEYDAGLGEVHVPETHLIPLVLDSALGRRIVEIYGDDYPTPDGTCVRDYIHVTDLAEAHVQALEYLFEGGTSTALNLGTGQGHSVREVINAAEKVTGRRIAFRISPRRAGDPSVLIADPRRALQVLDWQARHSSLQNIIDCAWKWQSQCRERMDRGESRTGLMKLSTAI